MDLFTDDLLATDSTKKLFAPANAVVDRLRARLIAELEMKPITLIPDRSHIITQSFVRRSLTFLEAGIDEYRNQRSLVTSVCARSNLENVAACSDFAATIIPLLIAHDREALTETLQARTFATRDPVLLDGHGKGMDAVNIITQINKIDKKNPGFRAGYDRLSDFVHPNGMGTTIHYTSITEGKAVFHEESKFAEWGMANLVLSALELAKMDSSINDLEKALHEFVLAGF